jgi:ribonuclease D
MAKSPPLDLVALKSVRGISPEQLQRRGKDILEAVQRALQLPESELPRVERRARYQPDAPLEARIERLKAVRNTLAQRYDLGPGVLCPNGVLEAIARVNPATREQLGDIRELRRWQLREIGSELLAALPPPASGNPS